MTEYKQKFNDRIESIETGSIFEARIMGSFAGFYEVIKKTAKTVTVREIEDKLVETIDCWESLHEPVRGAFKERGIFLTGEKRCTLTDDGSGWPSVTICTGLRAWLSDGQPALRDTYN